jgi:hypothetical protein
MTIMYQLRSVFVASLLILAVPTIVSTASASIVLSPSDSKTIVLHEAYYLNHFLISQAVQGMPTVQTEDWTKKDAKLPWNQIVLDKSFSNEEQVIFTKSSKYKQEFFSGRKERVRARWTHKNVELFVMNGNNCGIFGCLSSDRYGLPKQIKATVDGQDYFLNTVQQDTYELTPEFKQAIYKASGQFIITVDKKVKFSIQEEAVSALKQLFATQPVSPGIN